MTRGSAPDNDLADRRARAAAAAPAVVSDVTVTDDLLHGVPVMRVRPDAGGDRTLLWFHGGGYRLGSARTFLGWVANLAVATKAEVVSVDYRLAPEHPFPEALLDACLAYAALIGSAQRLVIGGESAGGGLAAALFLAIADRGLEPPVGAVLCSPWLDLRNDAASFAENAGRDELFPLASAERAAELYRNGHPADDPYISPLLGRWPATAPPILVQASSAESLRDDAVRLGEAAPTARVELYDDVPHVWHLGYPDAPGSVEAVASIARFVAEVTSPVPRDLTRL